MGYPMTFQRFLNRNGLKDGGYGKPPEGWGQHWQERGYVRDAFTEREREFLDQANRDRGRLSERLGLVAGDLRRLEAHAVDENGICKYIAGRISIPEETVAAVLKEFMAW
jgi:hypothetical protein